MELLLFSNNSLLFSRKFSVINSFFVNHVSRHNNPTTSKKLSTKLSLSPGWKCPWHHSHQ